jgi:hypothetical protein
MSTVTTDLVYQLDATLAEAERINATKLAEAMLEYSAVVKGAKKSTPADLLKLLAKCNLTPDDFRSDAAAWKAYQGHAASVVPADKIDAAHRVAAAAFDAEEAFFKTTVAETERLRNAASEASHAATDMARKNEDTQKRMNLIKTENPRIFG